jgi:O-antigen/teichoic acid export membrane protein
MRPNIISGLFIHKSAPILFAQVFYKIVSITILFFITRKFLPFEIGIYLFAFSFTELFLTVVEFGSPNFLIREVAKNKANTSDYLGTILGLSLVLSFLSLVLIGSLVFIFFKRALLMTLLVAISLIINQINQNFSSVFYAHKKIKYALFSGITSRILLLILFFLFLQLTVDLIYLAALYIISSIYLFVASLFLERNKIARFKIIWDKTAWIRVFKMCVPFFIIAVSSKIYFKIDTIMITTIRGYAETAFYESPFRIIAAAMIIPFSFTPVVYPLLSKLSGNKEAFKIEHKKVLNQQVLLSCLLALFLFFFSKPIIELLFGEEFYISWKVLSILSLTLPFLFIRSVDTMAFFSLGREKQAVYIMVLIIAVKIILNGILIPIHGFFAASVTTLITEIMLFTFFRLSLVRYHRQ